MLTRTSLIATLSTAPSPDGKELAALPPFVDALEIPARFVGDFDPDWLRQHFHGELLYELDATNEVDEKALSAIPPEARIVSWRGETDDVAELQRRLAQISTVPARFYKLVVKARTIAEEFLPLHFLKSLDRTDVVAYANGSLGFWTRLVALQLGAPAIFGLVSPGPLTSEPTVAKLIDDYGLPEVRPVKEIFAIIGNPIFHSLSPRLHNASYRAMNYHALFVPLQVDDFAEFWRDFVQAKQLDTFGFPINGMTVASPHKEEAFRLAKNVSAMVQQTQAANILIRNNGWWRADTTDPDVVYAASNQKNVDVREKRAAVIGCGGAGRAIAAALAKSGAGVTLINRGAERGERAASLLGLPYIPLPDFDAEGYDIVVNATPVGRDTDEAPFKVERLNSDAVVIDLVYASRPTPLIDSTVARHQVAIDGRHVLMTQVRKQFLLMTGKEMPAITLDK
ncbi:MAG TPA: type I 3-dehydroquinate dehydratase [Pyrinomonadaceae bacterium]